MTGTAPATTRAESPYAGPRPFTRTDRDEGVELYGRDAEVETLFNLLISQRIVVLYSPSGAGKTSLIEAKLVPRVEEEGLLVFPTARVGQEPPKNHGSTGSNRYSSSVLSSLGALKTDQPGSLGEFLDAARRDPNEPQLLVLDQFEEVLIEDPTDREAKEEFFRQLGAALRDRGRWALISMREDYVAGLDPYLRFLPTRLTARFRLDLLRQDAAMLAITEPAAHAHVDFRPVAQRLVTELSMTSVQRPDGVVEKHPGLYVEPVQLQVVCLRIWQHRPAGATRIEEQDVEAVGDVDDALAAYYAERVGAAAESTGARERDIREWVHERLITRQGVRGQVLQGVETSEGLTNEAIWAMVDAHLVRAERRRGFTWFELAHDRLIEPIRRDNIRWFENHLSMLQRQAAEWDRFDHAPHLLLRGRPLRDAEHWRATQQQELTPTEQEFLAVSAAARTEEERKLNTLIRIAAGIAVAVAIICVALAVAASNLAGIAQARELAVQASQQAVYGNPELALLLAREAVTRGPSPSPEAEFAFRQAALESHARLTLRGHTDWVWTGAYSPDGSRILTVSQDHTARIWDAASGQELLRLAGNPGLTCGGAFSPDGMRIVTVNLGQQPARIWDAGTGNELLRLDVDTQLVCSVAFSPDGTRVLTGGTDGAAHVSDASSGRELFKLQGSSGTVWSAAFSPDGTRIVTATNDGTAHIWGAATRQEQTVLTGHTGGPVWQATFSPDGNLVATAGNDQTARIWDAATGDPLQVLKGHVDIVTAVAFSPDEARLATAGHDTTARVWDVASGTQLLVLRGHANGIRDITFSPDGTHILTTSDDRTARIWNASLSGELAVLRGHTSEVFSAAFSPDGTQIATASDDRTVRIWDAVSGKWVRTLDQHTDIVWHVAYSPDGASLASASSDGTARIWDTKTWSEVLNVPHIKPVRVVTFSPDGTLIATGSSDGHARVFDARSGRRVLDLFKSGDVRTAAFSPDGATLVTGGTDEFAHLWNARTGEPLFDLEHGATVRMAAFSPDGKKLVTGSGDNLAQVWDVQTGQRILRLEGHTEPVWSASFSPDGSQLLTGSEDGTLRVWDATTGRPLFLLTNPTGPLRSAAYNQDGSRVVFASGDGTARIVGGCELKCSLQDLLTETSMRLRDTGRVLSPEERNQYLQPMSIWSALLR